MSRTIKTSQLLPTQLMVRLIQSNQHAGRNVSITDNVDMDLSGGVRLDKPILHKMAVGGQRYYVSDINIMVNQGQLSIIVSK